MVKYSEYDSDKDLGDSIKRNVHLDKDKHELRIFGHNFDVGSTELATIFGPIVNTAIAQVSIQGAAKVGRSGTKMALNLGMKDHYAGKAGMGLYYLWLYGLSGADVALDIKKTVQEGLRDMHALRDQAQPLLAANSEDHHRVGLSEALTSKSTALANARAKVYEHFKNNLKGTLASAIRVLPNVAMGYYQSRLDRITNPERVWEVQYHPDMPIKDKKKLLETMRDLKVRQLPRGATEEYEKAQVTLTKEFHEVAAGKTSEEIEQLNKEWAGKRKALKKDFEAKRTQSLKKLNGDDPSAETNGTTEDKVKKAYDLANDKTFWRRMLHPKNNYGAEYRENIRNLMLAPAAASAIGDIVDKKITDQKVPETAWDRIIDLQEALKRHHDPDRSHIEEKVQEIFKQHAWDLGYGYSVDNGQTFKRDMEAITDALIKDRLHPQAIAEMLDNKKIVTFGKDDADFGDVEDVKREISKLETKYSRRVTNQDVYRGAPFTKEMLVTTFNGVPDKEKPFFTLLFPPGVLENAGIAKDEVERYRSDGKQYFLDELTNMTRVLIDMGHERLHRQGVKNKQIDALEALQAGFQEMDQGGDQCAAKNYIEDHMQEAQKVVRDIAAGMKKPDELWKAYVSSKDGAKTPLDHAERPAGDDHQLST